jgi:hypothetical protein
VSCFPLDAFVLDKRVGEAYKNGPYEEIRPVVMISIG